MPVMPKYICKVSHHMGQFRLTIPKALVASMGWEDVKYMLIKEVSMSAVMMRRFVDGESLKSNHADDPAGSN